MSKCVLLLIFAFSLLHCNTARSNTFSSAFQIELEKATNAPQAIIDEFEPLLGKKESIVSFSQFEIHFLLGNAYYSQFLADKALFHYLAAKQIINKSSEPWRYYSLLSQLALAYELAGDATQALPFANEALQWAIQNQDLVLEQNALIAKGVTELTLGEYDNALESFQNAHSLSTEHPDAIKADNLSYDLAYHESVTQIIGRKLTCSVGITDATQCDNEHDVLNVADKAMYRAKKIGRDAIAIS